jgi:hypothetical protein
MAPLRYAFLISESEAFLSRPRILYSPVVSASRWRCGIRPPPPKGSSPPPKLKNILSINRTLDSDSVVTGFKYALRLSVHLGSAACTWRARLRHAAAPSPYSPHHPPSHVGSHGAHVKDGGRGG